jgi:hypothetical protein
MQAVRVLEAAKAAQKRFEQALKANPEFQLYQLTPPGPGRETLFRSLVSSSENFRGWNATSHVIAQISSWL